MKIAYLVLAHANPKHLAKMVAFLSSGDSSVFVHIDRKSDTSDFQAIKGRKVRFTTSRIPVYWGEYSMVEAILILITQALGSADRPDYCVLLSGSDYPIRSNGYIREFFSRNAGAEFISVARVPTAEAGIFLSKVNRIAIPSTRPALKFATKVCARLGLAERDYRKHLGTLQPFAGSTWWALTRDACEHILEFAERNKSVCEYFQIHVFIGRDILSYHSRQFGVSEQDP